MFKLFMQGSFSISLLNFQQDMEESKVLWLFWLFICLASSSRTILQYNFTDTATANAVPGLANDPILQKFQKNAQVRITTIVEVIMFIIISSYTSIRHFVFVVLCLQVSR